MIMRKRNYRSIYFEIKNTVSFLFLKQESENRFYENAILMSSGPVPYLLSRTAQSNIVRRPMTQNNSMHYINTKLLTQQA